MTDSILYIGLGRAGSRIIDRIKFDYLDQSDGLPETVKFLGISFSDVFKSLSLTESETVSLDMATPLQNYLAIKDTLAWMPETNVGFLPLISPFGTSHVRTNGKFAFLWNYDKIYKALMNTLSSLTDSMDNLTVKIVSSMSGGTGGANVANLAYMISGILPRGTVQLYAILPQMYINAGDCPALLASNAYETMRELDFLMTSVTPENPYMVSYIGGPKQFTCKPFRHVFAFNSKFSMDYAGEEIRIADAIKLSDDCSSPIAYFLDNIQMTVLDGTFDVVDKKSWLCLMSSSRVALPQEEVPSNDIINALVMCKPADFCPVSNFGFVTQDLTRYYLRFNKEEVGEEMVDKLYESFETKPDITFVQEPLGYIDVLSMQGVFPAFFIDGLLQYEEGKEQLSGYVFTGMDQEFTNQLDQLSYSLRPQETGPVVEENNE